MSKYSEDVSYKYYYNICVLTLIIYVYLLLFEPANALSSGDEAQHRGIRGVAMCTILAHPAPCSRGGWLVFGFVTI